MDFALLAVFVLVATGSLDVPGAALVCVGMLLDAAVRRSR